jgi:hypothetical protein
LSFQVNWIIPKIDDDIHRKGDNMFLGASLAFLLLMQKGAAGPVVPNPEGPDYMFWMEEEEEWYGGSINCSGCPPLYTVYVSSGDGSEPEQRNYTLLGCVIYRNPHNVINWQEVPVLRRLHY